MAFRNPILAGTTLIRDAIQSSNYLARRSGWQIATNGTAEFNDITIRGGTNVGGTALYYAGTPAAGNLRYSISDTAGTDAYGNGYGVGIIAYAFGHTGDIGLVDGEVLLGHAATAFAGSASLRQTLLFGGDVLIDSGTGDASHTDSSYVQAIAGTNGQTTGSATAPHVVIGDGQGVSDVDALISGSWIKTDKAGTHVTWQSPSYATGWAGGPAGGSVQPLQYRLDAQDNLVIVGAAHNTGSAGGTVFTLPAGYRPLQTQRGVAVTNSGGTGALVFYEVNTSGVVSINAVPSGDLYLNMVLPLGHIA
jgi:hypothetical protein